MLFSLLCLRALPGADGSVVAGSGGAGRSMVKHQPLQYYEPQLCLSCLTGIYGCRWKRYQRSHDDTTKVSRRQQLAGTSSLGCWVVGLGCESTKYLIFFLFIGFGCLRRVVDPIAGGLRCLPYMVDIEMGTVGHGAPGD